MSGAPAAPQPKRVLVWGAGAIGGTIGAHAAREGHEVTFVDNDAAHVAAIREHGLRIIGPISEFAVSAPAYLPQDVTGTWDMVLLCVKAHHTGPATAELVPRLAPGGYVVSLQNGLNEHTISRQIGSDRTVGAFVNFGADVLEPGVVHFSGRGAVVVGELDGRTSERVADVLSILRCAEPDAIATDNIWGYLWGKMAYGAMLFATALTDDSIADVLANPDARDTLTALALEVSTVTAAEGVTPRGFNGYDPAAFAPDGQDRTAQSASFDAMEAFNRRSAKARSGVWRDLAVRHRKTEVDGQFLPILEMAVQHGIAVPHLIKLVDLIHEVEDGLRPRDMTALQAISETGSTEQGADVRRGQVFSEAKSKEEDATSR